MTLYIDRLSAAINARGRICVGIDPQPAVLDAWGLPHTATGAESCARDLIAAIGTEVAVFKPQSAFFEVFGSAGIAALERVLSDISAAGAVSILDVKRGDIGSTMAGYGRAYLEEGSPLAADAITLSPYLGFGSLMPAIDIAISNGRGVYILARTSNPEGHEVQLAQRDGVAVAQAVVDSARELNAASAAGSVGLVVGGTHADLGIDLHDFNGSILVPGIGAQGGKLSQLAAAFGDAMAWVLPAVSREVLLAGGDPEALRAKITTLLADGQKA